MEQGASLTNDDILAILRAADELIGQGGRSLLAKILKGSKDKRLLERGLDKCPVYGVFRSLTLETITGKIDWMIHRDFLKIEYSGKLPMIVYSERGWAIERKQRVQEFLCEWDKWLREGRVTVDMTYLKDRNREMILQFLDEIAKTGNSTYIPYLEQWETTDYKKVRQAIRETIERLRARETRIVGTENDSGPRPEAIPIEIPALERESLTCWECGSRFWFEPEEQQFYRSKGFEPPKRCPSCRERKKMLREYGIDLNEL